MHNARKSSLKAYFEKWFEPDPKPPITYAERIRSELPLIRLAIRLLFKNSKINTISILDLYQTDSIYDRILARHVPTSNRPELEKWLGPLPNLEARSSFERLMITVAAIRNETEMAIRNIGKGHGIPDRIVDRVVSHVHQAFPDTHIAEMAIQGDQHFIEDLSSFMESCQIDAEARVAYIGSGNDRSARRAFPNTIHIDINKPDPIPQGHSFIQASAETLPFPDASLDVALFKCFPEGISSPEIARELNRVLKPNGILLSHGNIRACDFSIPPKKFKETQKQNQTLRQLINLLRHHFRISKREAHGLAVLERGEDKVELDRLEKILERNRILLADQIRSSPDTPSNKASIAILQEFGLGFGQLRKMSRQDLEKKLEPIKASAFSPFYVKIVNDLLEAQRKDKSNR